MSDVQLLSVILSCSCSWSVSPQHVSCPADQDETPHPTTPHRDVLLLEPASWYKLLASRGRRVDTVVSTVCGAVNQTRLLQFIPYTDEQDAAAAGGHDALC